MIVWKTTRRSNRGKNSDPNEGLMRGSKQEGSTVECVEPPLRGECGNLGKREKHTSGKVQNHQEHLVSVQEPVWGEEHLVLRCSKPQAASEDLNCPRLILAYLIYHRINSLIHNKSLLLVQILQQNLLKSEIQSSFLEILKSSWKASLVLDIFISSFSP